MVATICRICGALGFGALISMGINALGAGHKVLFSHPGLPTPLTVGLLAGLIAVFIGWKAWGKK